MPPATARVRRSSCKESSRSAASTAHQKTALNKFTNALGSELWGTGIRVDTIEPHSTVRTAAAVSFVGENVEDYGGALLPDGEFEEMETLVEAVLELCDCSPERTAGVHDAELLAELRS